MPVFAVERAQEMIARFAKLILEQRISATTPIFLDSPMAVEATRVFSKSYDSFDKQTLELAEHGAEALKSLHLLKTAEESKQLNKMAGPAIIMSSAGMCNAGRIKHHLANHIGNPKNSVVFLGYQAQGTLGRLILTGTSPVRILGQMYAVRAEIVLIRGISGHADQSELLAWYSAIPNHPKTTFVVHGEPAASNALAEKIREIAPETTVFVPEYKEVYVD